MGGRRWRQGLRTVLDPQQFPNENTEFFLTGPAGRLECLADVAEPGSERAATIVLCHPHPLHGGTLRNKVVTIMERAMRELGLSTVRFNFRPAIAKGSTTRATAKSTTCWPWWTGSSEPAQMMICGWVVSPLAPSWP